MATRRADSYDESQFATGTLGKFVPGIRLLRPIRECVNDVWITTSHKSLSTYEAGAKGDRSPIAPEKVMRAMPLPEPHRVRSDRQLIEQIPCNLFSRWFVRLPIEDTVRNNPVFSRSCDRRVKRDVVTERFSAAVTMVHKRGLLSGDRCGANGMAQQGVAVPILFEGAALAKPVIVGADKAHDTKWFTNACRETSVTPHAAQNLNRRRGSVIDGRTTRHSSCNVSQRKRRCIEQCFSWGKLIGPVRQVMAQGVRKADRLMTPPLVAYNLTRLRTLEQLRPQCARCAAKGQKWLPGTRMSRK